MVTKLWNVHMVKALLLFKQRNTQKWLLEKKEELKITSEQTERLVELYQEEVDLWNFSSPNYHNKDIILFHYQNVNKNKFWREILIATCMK